MQRCIGYPKGILASSSLQCWPKRQSPFCDVLMLCMQALMAKQSAAAVRRTSHSYGFRVTAQVAMMFLTRGEIHQEPLWKLWFQHLSGLVPVSALRVSGHIESLSICSQKACRVMLCS